MTLDALWPQLVGTRVYQAIQQALQQGLASLLSQTLHAAPLPLYRTPAEHKAGTRMQQMIIVKPLALPSVGRHCLVQISDVTSAAVREQLLRKQAQRMQDLAEECRQASRVKSAFLANMSHEIRTPVNGVIGMLSLLLNTDLSTEQREYAAVVHRWGTLLTLLNDILDLSKIEAGHLVLEHIPFDVRLTVEDVVDLMAERTYSKGVELVCLIGPEVPRLVCGDPTRLRQVLTNLLEQCGQIYRPGRGGGAGDAG